MEPPRNELIQALSVVILLAIAAFVPAEWWRVFLAGLVGYVTHIYVCKFRR